MPLHKTSPNSIIVPSAYVEPRERRWKGADIAAWVWIVREGKVYKKFVEVGWDDLQNAEIIRGIEASDLIISNNGKGIAEGTPVKIEQEP